MGTKHGTRMLHLFLIDGFLNHKKDELKYK